MLLTLNQGKPSVVKKPQSRSVAAATSKPAATGTRRTRIDYEEDNDDDDDEIRYGVASKKAKKSTKDNEVVIDENDDDAPNEYNIFKKVANKKK